MIQGLGQEITEIPAFGHDITEVRAMGKLAWQKSTSIPDYLCFTALESGTFTLTIPAAVTASYISYVEWSKDGRTWTHTDNTSGEVVTIQVDVTSGDKVYWRGKAQRYATSTNNYCCFSSDCRFTAKGVLKSLLFSEDFVTHVDGTWTSVYNYALSQLFRGCTNLIDASELILPSGHLAVAQLLGLFRDCTNLVRGADLPATGVNGSSYYWLYYNCTSLERLPNIAATTITDISGGNGNYAFYYAFYGCTSMTGSVTLNLTQVKGKQMFDGCFWRCKISSVDITMQSYDLQGVVFRNCFYDCTNLNHVRCTIDPSLATSDDFQNWLSGVSSTGTFIQAEGVTWPRGASGIPTGWVDVEKRTMPSGYKQVEYVANPDKGAFNFEHVFDSATETLEIQFFNIEKKGFFIGTTNNGGYYGSIIVDKSTNTAIRIKVGIGDATINTTTISVALEKPYVFRYKGKSDGFTIYLNGTAQKVYSGGFNIEHTISNLYVYSAAATASAVETYPDWFGEYPLYSIKVLDANDAAIINLIPCVRESDNLVGFYDFGRNKFYFSANGNNFTAGEEI